MAEVGDNKTHTFPKSISLKLNVLVWLEFELAYYDIAFQQVNHSTTFVICKSFYADLSFITFSVCPK